jgi:predicted nucleotidyltransferase
VLHEHFSGLAAEFMLSSLQLFGSFATDEATASSDVDLLTADEIKENRRPFLISSLVHGAL